MSAPDPLSVLVVDDNDVNRMLVRRQLEKLDARATCVENATAALASFTSESYAAVLLDCRLPLVDGFEVARQMRRWEAEQAAVRPTPIIALTARREPGLRERALASGMDDLLHKPASLGDLQGVLARWAAGRAEAGYPLDLAVFDRMVEEIESPGAVRALVDTYLQQLPLRTAGLRAAVLRGDAEAVSALAQELRASGEPLGAVRLGGACLELEAAAASDGGLVGDTSIVTIQEIGGATANALRAALARTTPDAAARR